MTLFGVSSPSLLGFLHPGLRPARWTWLCCPPLGPCGSPAGLTPAGARRMAALRYAMLGCPPPQAAVVTPDDPGFISAPTLLSSWDSQGQIGPRQHCENSASPGGLDCQQLENCWAAVRTRRPENRKDTCVNPPLPLHGPYLFSAQSVQLYSVTSRDPSTLTFFLNNSVPTGLL